MFPDQLIVTPATRGDIISALIDHRETQPDEPEHGLILTGHRPPLPSLLARLKQAQIPTLYTDCASYDAMCRISSFTAKIHKGDISKVEKAIELVESSIDFSYLV
jgi:BioD-like phosphotransacetylase family protein